MKWKSGKGTRRGMRRRMTALVMAMLVFFTGCGSATDSGSVEKQVNCYGFNIFDAGGEAVSGASVTFGGLTASTGSNGYVEFEESEETDTSGTTTLSVTKSGYKDYVDDSYVRKGSESDTIRLIKAADNDQRLQTALYGKDEEESVDLLSYVKRINAGDTAAFSITAKVTAGEDKVKTYQLRQDNHLIMSSTTGTFTGLYGDNFNVGTNVYVRVLTTDGTQVDTSLNLEVDAAPEELQATELDLGEGLTFTVGDDVPVFGGMELTADLPELPVTFNCDSDGSVKIGFNLSDDALNDDGTFKSFEEIVTQSFDEKADDYSEMQSKWATALSQYEKENKKGKLLGFNNDEADKGVSAVGYAMATMDKDGKLTAAEGYLAVTASIEKDFGWQFQVWVIPVTVDLALSAGVTAANKIHYDVENERLTGDITLSSEGEIEARAGVGFDKVLSGGIYGALNTHEQFNIAWIGNIRPGLTNLFIGGEFGLYGYAGPFDISKALVSGEVQIYPQTSTESLTGASISDAYDIANYSLIAADTGVEADATGGTEAEETEVQTTDQMQTVGEVKMATGSKAAQVQTTDQATEVDGVALLSELTLPTTDNLKDLVSTSLSSLENQQVLAADMVSVGNEILVVYEVLDEDSNSDTFGREILEYRILEEYGWSDAKKLSSDVSYEFAPDLCSTDSGIYLAYQKSDAGVIDFDTSDTAKVETFAKTLEIETAQFDLETGEFKDFEQLSQEGTEEYNRSPVISCVNDQLTVSWIENVDGDYFGKNNTNKIVYRTSTLSGSYQAEQTFAENCAAVSDLAVGNLNGSTAIAYTVDASVTDQSSTEDETVTIYGTLGTTEHESVTGHAFEALKFVALPGDSTSQLVAYENKNLVRVNDNCSTLWSNSNSEFSSNYSVTDNAILYAGTSEENKNTYMVINQAGTWSNPIQVASQDMYNSKLMAVSVDNYIVLNNLSILSDSDEGLNGAMLWKCMDQYSDIAVSSVMVDATEAQIGKALPVTVKVTNTGIAELAGYHIAIQSDTGQILFEKDYTDGLTSGNSREVTIATTDEGVFIPDSLGTYTVTVSLPEGTEDINTEDNEKNFALSYSDLAVTSQIFVTDTYNGIIAKVDNDGNVSTDGKIVIYNINDPDTILASYDVNTLDAGASQIFKLNIEESWYGESGDAAFACSVTNNNTDLYSYNNQTTAYAMSVYNEYAISYELNGGTMQQTNPSSYVSRTGVSSFKSPVKTGYVFEGWYTSSDFDPNTKITKVDVDSNGDLKLYAKWKLVTYNISFQRNRGTGSMVRQTLSYNQTAALSKNTFTRAGYTFSGWNTSSGGWGTSYQNQQKVCNLSKTQGSIIYLYAQWKANTYTVKYNANGGKGSMSSLSCNYGSTYGLTANKYTKANYVFAGWNTKKNGTGITYRNSQSISNLTTTNKGTVTLYAQWTPASYKITFNANGGKVKGSSTKTVTYNQKYKTLPVAQRSKYTFAGWYTKKSGGTKVSTNTVCKKSVTVYAHWKKVSVKSASVKSLSAGKKMLTVKWKKVSGVKGYQIQYSLSSKMKSAKSKTVTGTSCKLTKLSAKKVYYVRIRAYSKDSTGSKVYGKWSKIVKKKTK